QAMTQHRRSDVADVVGSGEFASTDRGKRFCAKQHRDGCTRARAVEDRRMLARAADDLDDILLHAWLHPHLADLATTFLDRLQIRESHDLDILESVRIKSRIPARDDLLLVCLSRI